MQLLNYVKTLYHQLFALLLSLGEEVCTEDDLWIVHSEHLKLILGLVYCMFDLYLEDANVVFEVSEFFFLIH